MPTHTTITENLDGTFSVQVHDVDALRRIQTMCDIIREDDDDSADDDRALTAAYAGDLYAVIGEALSAATQDALQVDREWLAGIIAEDDPANGGYGLLTLPAADVAACHRCGRTDNLDTAPGRATTCHPCALDGDLSRHLAANRTAAETGDDACGLCNGEGAIYFAPRIGNVTCPSCGGTGTA